MSNSKVKKRVFPPLPAPGNNLISKIISYIKGLPNKIFMLFMLLLISILFLLNYIINNINKTPVRSCEQKYQELTEENREIKYENYKLKEKNSHIQLLLDKSKSELEKCNEKSELVNRIAKLINLQTFAHIAEILDTGIPEDERSKIYYSIFYNKRYLEIINDIDKYNQTSKDLSNKDKVTNFEKEITNKICEEKQNKDRIIEFLCQLPSVQTLPK